MSRSMSMSVSENIRTWVVVEIRVHFVVPNIVRHAYEKNPKRNPDLENYPHSMFQGGARSRGWPSRPRGRCMRRGGGLTSLCLIQGP